MSSPRRRLPPPITLVEFYQMPNSTRLEVYVAGTGMWTLARLYHRKNHSAVVPECPELSEHEVVIKDDMPDIYKEIKLKLVRRPHPQCRMVEDGDYRQFLEQTAVSFTKLLRKNISAAGASSPTAAKVLTTARVLMTTGGFLQDLWVVMKEAVHDEFQRTEGTTEGDDLLLAILADIRGNKH